MRIRYILILLIILSFAYPVNALKDPWQYGNNECELIAKDYQAVHGGYLVFIQPLKSNGAYDLGEYNGHFLNKVYTKEKGLYYIDYYSQIYFNNTQEISKWYKDTMNKNSEIFDLSVRRPGFNLIWHY